MTAPILFMVAYSTYLIGYWGLLGFIVVFGSIPIKVNKDITNIVFCCKINQISLKLLQWLDTTYSIYRCCFIGLIKWK